MILMVQSNTVNLKYAVIATEDSKQKE